MNCPQCSSNLNQTVYEDVPIDACDACGGEFIGGGKLGQIVRTRQERFSPELKATLADHRPKFGGTGTQPDRALCCPGCGETMRVVNYSGDSGVFVDRCDSCDGLWLDHEELEKVQVVLEQWADEALEKIQAVADDVELARTRAALSTDQAFSGSRFSFVNALINRVLDAA